jgi:hypothetical protein
LIGAPVDALARPEGCLLQKSQVLLGGVVGQLEHLHLRRRQPESCPQDWKKKEMGREQISAKPTNKCRARGLQLTLDLLLLRLEVHAHGFGLMLQLQDRGILLLAGNHQVLEGHALLDQLPGEPLDLRFSELKRGPDLR